MVKNFSVLVACTLKNGIGIEGKMAWYIKEDLNMFQKKTTNQVVVMGRNTFLSLPASQRPLKNRINIVVSRSWLKMENKDQQPENVIVVNCLNDALKHAKDFYSDREIFVIGGSHLYETAFDHFACKDIYLTQVFDDIACTVFMQPFDSSKFEIMDPIQPIQKSESKGNLTYQMRHYQRKHEEYQYLNLIRKTMNITNVRMDRTEIGTYSTFGNVMKFSLRNNQFPLLTTKNVFFRGVVEELLWIMRGETNSKTLNAKRVCIWDKDGSQSNGDLGPIYGHQWRHAGAKYPLKNNNNNANLDKLQTIIQDLELSTFIEDLRKDLNYVGIDQLKKLIHDLRTDPSSRRMVTSSWNVKDIDAMALPPCHIMFQMKINYANELSCLMFQRSGDLGLGVPFNIASYSLLTCLIAWLTGFQPGDFIHVIGDTHVYSNHEEQLREQLLRTPRDFPTLKFDIPLRFKDVTPVSIDIDDLLSDLDSKHFQLSDYHPHEKLKMEMAYKPKQRRDLGDNNSSSKMQKVE